MTDTVSFSQTDLERFKIAYDEAVKNGDEVFDFGGHEYFTGYAKYLIQHLDTEFSRHA